MAIANLIHGVVQSTNTNAVTTPSFDSTGGTLLVVVAVGVFASPTVSDSKSNTWTKLTEITQTEQEAIFYVANPTVGTGHTITIGPASGSYSAGAYYVFSGVATTTPFDVQNGAGVFAASVQPGSITPGSDNELIICGASFETAGSGTGIVDSSMSTPDTVARTANGWGCSGAYKVQTTATAINPTWTESGSGSDNKIGVIASFKAAAAGGAFVPYQPAYFQAPAGGY